MEPSVLFQVLYFTVTAPPRLCLHAGTKLTKVVPSCWNQGQQGCAFMLLPSSPTCQVFSVISSLLIPQRISIILYALRKD